MPYLDNAASTPVAPDVLVAMARAAEAHFANPAAAHGPGAAAARALEAARAEIAALVRGAPAEVVFTSGGTEANALGLLGAAANARQRHAVVSAIEHPAVLRNAERLEASGWTVTRVAPDAAGLITPGAITAALRPETALVAVMLVNNELGTLQPIAEIAGALRAAGSKAHVHVDAVQAAGLVPAPAGALGADTLALSAHKLHGPKGVGALWIRPGARVAPLWDGGRQEGGLRSGTENLPGVVGFAAAAALAREAPAGARVAALRDRLEALLFEAVPEARPTVTGAPRAPHITSVTLPALPAEPLLHALEARGVYVSAGSACASRTRGPSHVLRAIGVREEDAVLRFSLSRLTDEADLPATAAALVEAVREVAPFAGGLKGRSKGRR
jgi:cysteine desulfurase